MSNIPLAREMINEVIVELGQRGQRDLAVRLMDIQAELYRRPLARPRAPIESRPVDARLAAELRTFARRNPTFSQQRIAELFRVNHGRVAEALLGDR